MMQQAQERSLPQHQQQFSTPRCHSLMASFNSSSRHERLARKLDDVKDVLGRMRCQEMKYYAGSTTIPTSSMPWRPILIQWMFSVVDIFQLVPQIVPTALYYLDRSLRGGPQDQLSPVQATMHYQLLGLTCLELAIKIHDTKLFPLEELVRMGHAGFTPLQVVAMESQLLEFLGWNLHPPTPHCFIHQYGELLQALVEASRCSVKVSKIVETALQIVRRGLYQQLTQPPAILAYAAILAAMEEDGRTPQTIKHSFCMQMVRLTGLTAHSPGLSQAYAALSPGMCNNHHAASRVESPTTIVAEGAAAALPAMVSTTSRSMSPPPPMYNHPHQQTMEQQHPSRSATTHIPAPVTAPQPPMVHASNQQWYAAAPSAAPATNDNYPAHVLSPPQAQVVASQPVKPPAPPSKYVDQPVMIYSAGEDLGFEVTLNVVAIEDYDVYNDDDDFDALSHSDDSGRLSLADSTKSWMGSLFSNLSPRNVSGALSPERV